MNDNPPSMPAESDSVQPWMDGLNPSQSRAVEHLDGPLLVLSGAGTGKTRVLTSRLAQLLATGRAKPWSILAVTFTNKAAREMKERVEAMIGPVVEQVWFGTFHALGARILRRHAELVGLKPNFTILDADDQLRLIKQLMEARGLDSKRFPSRMVLAVIERWKDKGLMPDQVNSGEAATFMDGAGGGFYHDYQSRLLELNACDFGDLLLHNLVIFTKYPDVLGEYHDRITHVMVDEYQDTNTAQYLWIRLLTQKSRNLCCVGDDDQSIYGWRGAEITNMLRFQELYPDAEVIRLEQNYRSTGHILRAASALIAHNENRLGKTLYTSIEDGDKVEVYGFWDGGSEAREIADKIESMNRNRQAGYSDMAILVRAGHQTREFEERFIQIGIPYRVVGAKFYERQEIRDAIAYLRLIAQPADDLAFERIINTPKRGLGGVTVQTIRRLARKQGMPMLAAAESLLSTDELKPAAKKNLTQIVNMFIGWRQDMAAMSHVDLAMRVLDESGYTAMWQAQQTPDAEGRLENLKELISSLENFDNLEGFLEHIALVMDGDSSSQQGEVTLMTLHAGKGLEFDVVFLPGWEEGLFPSQRTLDEKGSSGLEEERRLGYVGITRARKKLLISYAASRRVHGQWQSSVPSRFIGELPDENIIEHSERGMISAGQLRVETNFAGLYPASPDSGGTLDVIDNDSHQVGDRVFHDKFGNGNVKSVEGNKLNIVFDKAGQKKVMSSFVMRLEKN